jgi:hypothetical protein
MDIEVLFARRQRGFAGRHIIVRRLLSGGLFVYVSQIPWTGHD